MIQHFINDTPFVINKSAAAARCLNNNKNQANEKGKTLEKSVFRLNRNEIMIYIKRFEFIILKSY